MDLREIQRLHAQFTPDSITINLPRQIAALPTPTAFESDTKSTWRSATSRFATSAPFVRSCAAPMMVAILVALAGIGAAKLYRAVDTGAAPQKSSVENAAPAKPGKAPSLNAASEAAARPIDATPTRPVAVAPVMSESNLSNASMHAPTPGLTADQFRNSLRSAASTSPTNIVGATTPASPVSDQTKLAAASPIRQSHHEAEAPRAATAQPPQAAPQMMPQVGPQAVQGESKAMVTAVTPVTPAAQPAAATPNVCGPPDPQLSAPRRACARLASPRGRFVFLRHGTKHKTRTDKPHRLQRSANVLRIPMKPELNITLIAPGCAITGDMVVDHGVSCFGLLDGGIISTQGLLHVGEGGLVKGMAQGEHVRIDGRVDGDIHARGSLEINGQVSGDIFYSGTIRLGPHAALNGTLKRVARMLTIEAETAPEQAATGSPLTVPERDKSNITDISRAIG